MAPSLEGDVELPDPSVVPGQLHLLKDLVLPLSEDLCPLQADVREVLPGPPLCPDLYQQTRQLQGRLHGHPQHQALPGHGQPHGLRLRRRGAVAVAGIRAVLAVLERRKLATDLEQNEQ